METKIWVSRQYQNVKLTDKVKTRRRLVGFCAANVLPQCIIKIHDGYYVVRNGIMTYLVKTLNELTFEKVLKTLEKREMKCKICGKKAYGEYCFHHKPRMALKKTSSKPINELKGNNMMMKTIFEYIWNNRPHKSEVSGDLLMYPPSSAYFHHILPKAKYPQAKYDTENIILLTMDEHGNVESDMYRYEEVNKRREKLKIKYNL